MLVQFGHQRALAIPLMWTDNVYALGLEGISGADHGTDVKIVGPVFHRNFEVVTPSSVKIGLNGSNGPVAVTVQYVAAVSVVQQHRVETTVIIRRSRIIGTRLTDGSQTTAQGRFHGIPVHLKPWQPKKSGWVRAIFLLDNAIHRFLLVSFAAQPG